MIVPHVGVCADIDLWRVYGPELEVGESVLADKAYVGVHDVQVLLAWVRWSNRALQVPHKKPKGGALTRPQRDHNRVLRSVRLICCSSSCCLLQLVQVHSGTHFRAV